MHPFIKSVSDLATGIGNHVRSLMTQISGLENRLSVVEGINRDLVTINPSDTTDLSKPISQLFVANPGTLSIIDTNGVTLHLNVVQNNTVIVPIHVSRVLATGTTATGLAGI